MLFALCCLSCSTADRDPAEATRRNDDTSAAAAPRAAKRGSLVDGDERSEWMLTTGVDGGTSIEEDARFGDDGQAHRVFTFDKGGTLLRATEQRTGTVHSGNASPAQMRSELIVDFSGPVPSARKMVDGVPRDVQSFEIDNIRRRADLLRVQAQR